MNYNSRNKVIRPEHFISDRRPHHIIKHKDLQQYASKEVFGNHSQANLADLSQQSMPDFIEGSSIPNMENNIFLTESVEI